MTINEHWRPVVGYEGHYEVSDAGRVKSLERRVEAANRSGPMTKRVSERIISTRLRGGYLAVTLVKEGRPRSWSIHRLVCLAFHGAQPDGFEVGHLNGIRADNRSSNLRWVTKTENAQHRFAHGTDGRGERNGRATLSARNVKSIRERASRGEPKSQIAREYGVTPEAIHAAVIGRNWAHVE